MILFIISLSVTLASVVINFFLNEKKLWNTILFILGIVGLIISGFQYHAETVLSRQLQTQVASVTNQSQALQTQVSTLKSQIIQANPFNSYIRTATADLTVNVTSSTADNVISHLNIDQGAISGFFKNGNQYLVMSSVDSFVSQVGGNMVRYTAHVEMNTADSATA